MSLFRGAIRPPTLLADDAVERYLAAMRAEIGPDPLFRRRLRGEVMNRYVAAREGIVETPRRRSMGGLGRAVLYATFTLAVTSTSVLAASQEALPGDALYPLKRQVESLRVQVVPAQLHDDLAAYALAERIRELGRLAERGEWGRVAIQAAEIERDYDALLVLSAADPADSTERYLTVLAGLVDHLPDDARAAVEAVIDRQPADRANPGQGGGPEVVDPGRQAGPGAAGAAGAAGQGGAPEAPAAGRDADPTPEPRPTRSPRPDPAPRSDSTAPQPRAPAPAADGDDEQ